MKNYQKLIVGSLLTAMVMASPVMSFAEENEKENRRDNEKKEEKSNRGNWFKSSWFNSKNNKKIVNIPIVSNLTITSNKNRKATIKWNTDLRSNSLVWYSTTPSIDTTKAPTIKRNDRVLKHKFELSKLQPNTKYYLVVGSSSNGKVGKSAEMSFITSAIVTSNSTPIITSATGTPTVKVGENATFTINASDPQNKALKYSVNWGDGQVIESTTFNQTVALTHSYSSKGTYIVKFTITNSDGKKATYPMQVKVTPIITPDTTIPTVTAFTIPATATTLAVNITTFTATDTIGVTGYKLTENTTAPLAGDTGWTTTAPTSYTFSTAGAKTLYAWAKDASGNVSSAINDSVIITLTDTTAPTISEIVKNIAATNVTISWTTNEQATGTVFYGTNASIDTNSISTLKVTDASMATNHSLSIPSLTANTLYHFIIKSVDASNNVTLSSEATFTTGN